MNDKLWGIKDVAEYLDIPLQTLYQWRSRGYGPPGIRLGRHVKYRPDDVRAWIASMVRDVA
jgi:excisionase family DNA binding protein